MYNSMKTVFADLKASAHWVFCGRILAVQATLSVLKLPFVGSKNISDANLEPFSYRTWQWSCGHCIWQVGTIFEVA